jgi:hypothetical protein
MGSDRYCSRMTSYSALNALADFDDLIGGPEAIDHEAEVALHRAEPMIWPR